MEGKCGKVFSSYCINFRMSVIMKCTTIQFECHMENFILHWRDPILPVYLEPITNWLIMYYEVSSYFRCAAFSQKCISFCGNCFSSPLAAIKFGFVAVNMKQWRETMERTAELSIQLCCDSRKWFCRTTLTDKC